MTYKLSPTPHYELECIAIINNIINNTPIKSERDEIIKNRGNKHKAAVTEFFKLPIAMEDHMRKNINLVLPPFEQNGKQLAQFLFKQYASPTSHYAEAVFHHIMSLEHGVDSCETAIIDHLDETLVANAYGQNIISSCTPSEFFALVEKANTTDEDKMAAMHLYYNFDMYHSYLAALLAHAKELYLQAGPNAATLAAPLMSTLESNLAESGSDYITGILGITPDETDTHLIYPTLYRVNSFAASDVYGTNIVVCEFGLHLLDFIDRIKQTSDTATAEELLKCISDNTKRSILQLLKKGPMYGSQLAKELNCTTANISHHLNRMLLIGIIRIVNENNRLYAHLEREKLHGLIDGLKEIF